MVSVLGLTGLPFINVVNGCATGGTSLSVADTLIDSGALDIGIAVGFDKHERGAFDASTRPTGASATGTARSGSMLTTQFFGMKITALHARLRHHPADARRRSRPRPSATAR